MSAKLYLAVTEFHRDPLRHRRARPLSWVGNTRIHSVLAYCQSTYHNSSLVDALASSTLFFMSKQGTGDSTKWRTENCFPGRDPRSLSARSLCNLSLGAHIIPRMAPSAASNQDSRGASYLILQARSWFGPSAPLILRVQRTSRRREECDS